MENVKLVVVGNGGSGKTTLLMSYTSGSYPSEYIPTIFDNYSANIAFEGKAIDLGLWDTAGGEDYHRLRPLSYLQTDVFLICFSVAHYPSFEAIWRGWYPEVAHHCPKAKTILVGLKHDLRESKTYLPTDWTNKNREMTFVPSLQAVNLARRIGAHAYIECSSLDHTNLDLVFDAALAAHFGRERKLATKYKPNLISSLKTKIMKLPSIRKEDVYNEKLVVSTVYYYRIYNQYAHSAVYINNKIFVFGGYKNLRNEFTDYPMVGNGSVKGWKDIKVDPAVFSPRSSLCSVVIKISSSLPNLPSSSSSPPPPPPAPPPPSSSSSSSSSSTTPPPPSSENVSVILLFGGKSNGYHNDTISVNPETNEFEKLAVVGSIPAARYGMTGVSFNNHMFIFGGYDIDSSPCNDCYKFNLELKEWTKVALTGEVPSPRFFHAATVSNNSMIIYGGKSGVEMLDDMYSINLVTGECKKIQPVSPTTPGPRQHHTMEHIGRGNIVLIGGMTKNKLISNEIFMISLETMKWQKMNIKGTFHKTYFHSSVYIESLSEIWVSGGRGTDDDLYLTKLRVAKNTPRIYDVLPRSSVLDCLSFLSSRQLFNLSLVNRKFNQLASDPLLWLPFAVEQNPNFTIAKDGDPRKYALTEVYVWYNNFETKPEPAIYPFTAPGANGFSYY